ncbi:MAG TPA: FGGY-family carbohydrate kinase [Verrucomicrobiae bacterium]
MLLGLDLGTTNVKALVTDAAGKPLARGSCPVQLFRLPDGGVEQDINEIWRATISAIKEAVRTVDPKDIDAIGVSSQGGAMQVLDKEGQPLGRVISWLDQRGRTFDETLTQELGKTWFLERIVHGGSWLSIGQVLRLRKAQPALFDPPNRIGFVGDIIVGRLCGTAAHDGTSCALTLFYNPKARIYDPDLLKRLALLPEQMPILMPPSVPAGGLTAAISRETGLRTETPVSPAVHDQYASALATGATRTGTVMVGTGTAWVLLHVTDQLPRPATDQAFVCHHVIESLWGQILSMVNGGSALTWALELTGNAGADGKRTDDLLASAPPGSDGVVFWPFMTPFGASALAPETRGRLDGLQLHHHAAHIIRAVVEGLGCELNRYLGLLRGSGQQVERLVMGGGAAASRVTPPMLADLTGLPLRCFAGNDASLIGAVVLARGLLEPKRSLAALAAEMSPASSEVTPGPQAAFYQERYERYVKSLPLVQRGTTKVPIKPGSKKVPS